MAIDFVIILVLMLLGIILIMVEIFLLPGITVAGIAGGIVLIGSIIYAFHYQGQIVGYTTIGIVGVSGIAAFVYLIKSKTLDYLALKTNIESKVEQSQKLGLKVGDKGYTLSRINPMGKVLFQNDITVEVKSHNGEFIDSQVEVTIVKIEEHLTILVEPIKNL